MLKKKQVQIKVPWTSQTGIEHEDGANSPTTTEINHREKATQRRGKALTTQPKLSRTDCYTWNKCKNKRIKASKFWNCCHKPPPLPLTESTRPGYHPTPHLPEVNLHYCHFTDGTLRLRDFRELAWCCGNPRAMVQIQLHLHMFRMFYFLGTSPKTLLYSS